MSKLRPAARLSILHLEDRILPTLDVPVSEQITIDQLGWRPSDQKIVVFADPISGQNAAVSYVPGSAFQIRRVSDDATVFTGNVVAWKNGATDPSSGDRAWRGDFTALNTPGEYYVLDPTNYLRSYVFSIQTEVYNDVLKYAGRMYFFQRSGFTKDPTYAGPWSHTASHLQEMQSRQIIGNAPQGVATERDLHGGWWDAGDYNKYVPFTTGVIWDLLSAYEWNPTAFSDRWNIPESGNGVPDILDEVRWELDWLLRMQLPNGSVLNRVGQTSYDVANSPTADTQPHYYTAATTWATASFAASTAHAARLFGAFDAAYAATLRTAAQNAWTYLAANPNMLPITGVDGGTLAAAEAGSDSGQDLRLRILAAAELWRLTGTATYKNYFEANYNNPLSSQNGLHPILNNRFDPSTATDLNRALITYALTPGANAAVVQQIQGAVLSHIDGVILPSYEAEDPYMAFMWEGHYSWGSNQLKANWATLLTYALQLSLGDTNQRALYRRVAEEYLHYFHGRNPLSMTYLSNAGSVGADKYPMEPYHGWWPSGSTLYDGANSTYGPAPGYMVGGPNQYFGVNWISPPFGEPPQKAYRDWNTGWNEAHQENENSWEINEPAIYYQSAYLLLVSQYATTLAAGGPRVVTSADQGGPSTVKVFTKTGELAHQINAESPDFTGGIRTATADINGDGSPEIFTVPGPGGSPIVNVYDGNTYNLIRQIQVYGITFTLGVNLAVGDVLGDGKVELIVAPDRGGAPFVNIFDPGSGSFLKQIQVYGRTFTLGVRVTVGDVQGDARKEILVAPQAGGAPIVNMFDAVSGSLVRQLQAFGRTFTGGLYLAAGNVNDSGKEDIVVGPGFTGAPVVNIFEGSTGQRINGTGFPIFGSSFTVGVRVGVVDADEDGDMDLVAGPGQTGSPTVKVKDGRTGADLGVFSAFASNMTAGLYLSGLLIR